MPARLAHACLHADVLPSLNESRTSVQAAPAFVVKVRTAEGLTASWDGTESNAVTS